jgi:hypothetical protein
MQHVGGFLELGDIHHPVDTARIPDANLSRTGTYIVERLPVCWLKPGLDLPQLETRFLTGVFWECQQIVVGRPYPTDLFFIVRSTMYKILYAFAGASQGCPIERMTNGMLSTEKAGVGRPTLWEPKLDVGSSACIRTTIHSEETACCRHHQKCRAAIATAFGSCDSTGHQANDRVLAERYKRPDSAGWCGATLGFGYDPQSPHRSEQRSIVADLLAKQRDNVGFGTSDLVGAWQRRDNTSLDKASDGYATGLIALALEQIGEPLTKPKLDRAISWLRHSQDPSDGRRPASSLNKQRELSSDAGRFMTDAATAYAVMAIENAK